jgi:anti-anti-sigma regulatory factor
MPTPILLPAYLSARSAADAVIACRQLLDSEGDATVDASPLRFADPFGLAMLGATFFMVQQQERRVRVCGLNADMAGYLNRMDVFEGVELVECAPPVTGRNNRSDVLVELTRLDNHNHVDDAAYRLAKSLVGGIPGVDPDEAPDEMTGLTAFDRLVEPIQYALSELLENALTHARRQGYRDACVWVASQYYPRSGTIRLGVVDNGCGFLATLRSHPELRLETHHEAILTALRPRISCNRDLRMGMESVNQGVGLTTTCRIAEHAGGRLVIVSGDAIHGTSGESGTMSGGATWQGVAIAMECRRDRLPSIRFRELLPPYEALKPVRLRFE